MNTTNWNKETRQAYVGTLLYSLLEIVAAILTPFAAVGTVAKLAGASGGGFLGVLLVLVELCVIAGYVMFFLAIKDLKEIAEGTDKDAFSKVYISIIFSILAALLGIFHLRIIAGICSIVACILLFLGYSALKKSETIAAFSPEASAGFKKLYTAQLLVIIGVVIGWIPIIGGFCGGILKIIAWIMVLLGWKAVATPVAAPGEEPVAAKPIVETVKEVVSESIEEAKEVVKDRKEVVQDAKETAKDVAADVKETAKDVAGDVKEAAKEVVEDVKEAAKEVGDKAKELGDKAKDKIDSIKAEKPGE